MILHLKNKILTLHHEIEIFDEQEKLAYKVTSKMISITDKTNIVNAEGKEVAHIHRKAVSIHEKYTVEMENGPTFELSTELLHVIDEVIDIDALGLVIKGNFLEHDYTIEDKEGHVLAASHKEWIALHEKYEIEINDESRVDEIVAIYVVLEHILTQRVENDTTAAASAASAASHH